jgi:hypothetical protein
MGSSEVEEHMSFAEACVAITGLEGQDQFVRISLPGTETFEFQGHQSPPAPRTFSLMRGQISVPEPAASGWPEEDFAFVLVGSGPYPPRFRIPESFFSDAFWDEDGRLIVELDGGVRLMVGDH